MENNNVFIHPIHDIIADSSKNCDGRCVIAGSCCPHLVKVELKPYPKVICALKFVIDGILKPNIEE